jgi:exopolyphosphatase/guanosine-5'-triphosphate,3'-diphosphate pyrophosphatase
MRVGIIDCGTNTFNYLLAEAKEGSKPMVFKSGKFVVKLGEHGFPNGNIHPDALQRAYDALNNFHLICLSESVRNLYGCATSAFRTAGNASLLVDHCKNALQFPLDIISGTREAELIHHGVFASGVLPAYPTLILDIGGGSNEMIISSGEQIHWTGSYPVGMARMMSLIKPSDPIKKEEVAIVNNLLDEHMGEVVSMCQSFGVNHLIGASGSFDTLAEMILLKKNTSEHKLVSRGYDFDMHDFVAVENDIITSSYQERLSMPGMMPLRAEMMVLAVLTIRWVLNTCKLSKLSMSGFSLKEGFLHERFSLKRQ